MNELIEFLHARLNEDERAARESEEHYPEAWTTDPNSRSFDPTRVLAEAESKRRLVELWSGILHQLEVNKPTIDEDPEAYRVLLYLKTLATPFAGHPDYRKEWKP